MFNELIGQNIIQIIGIFSLAIIPLFGILFKPKYSIWGYIFLPLIIPKDIVWSIGNNSLLLYFVLEISFAMGIFLALMKNNITLGKLKVPNYLKSFFVLISCMFILSTLIPIFFSWMPGICDIFYERGGDLPNQLYLASKFLSALIFFFGVMAFIRELKEIEAIFKIFVWLGVLGAAENVLFYHFGLFGLQEIISSVYTSYDALIIGTTDTVGKVMILAVFSSLYFLYSTGKMRYLLMHLIFLIPLYDTRQRALFLGLFMGYLFVFYFYSSKKIRNICFAGIAVFFIYVFIEFNGAGFITDYRRDFLKPTTVIGRMAMLERSADVMIYTFPFGTGSGYVPHAMNSQDIPTHEQLVRNPYRDWNNYLLISSGEREASVHNLWMEYVCEYGLLGVTSMTFFLIIILHSFKLQRRLYYKVPMRINNLSKCCGAMLVAFNISFIASSAFDPYGLIFLLLFLNVLIVSLGLRLDWEHSKELNPAV